MVLVVVVLAVWNFSDFPWPLEDSGGKVSVLVVVVVVDAFRFHLN